ncbi:MAG: hypothetical protein K2X74_20980, partial [Acetobacteraceae bacterium]|nr:hypothetical protein [Acetobacteraceae bacterium]
DEAVTALSERLGTREQGDARSKEERVRARERRRRPEEAAKAGATEAAAQLGKGTPGGRTKNADRAARRAGRKGGPRDAEGGRGDRVRRKAAKTPD